MEKPKPAERYLNDWDAKLTDEWIDYAQTMQSSHCQNIGANEKGAKYTEELFHKIDDLVLIHAFGASTKKSALHSDIRMNFNSSQRRAAEEIRKKILKYGKTKEPTDKKSYVIIQVISVTMMLVDCPKELEQEKKDEDETGKEKIPGVSQVAVFRIVTPDDTFCFIDHTGRYYESWNDYLGKNNLPRCKMCYPKNGVYEMKEQSGSNVDENNNEKRYALDLQLSESISCTNWQRFKSGVLVAVSYVGLVAGVVSIVAAPFTGGASVGVYATYAAATAGWVSFGCMMIGAVVNLGSMWDKFWHDEPCLTEIASLAMLILHYGVAKYNAKMIDKLKFQMPVTRTELILMTVLNCTRFAVDSIMFVMTFTRLVMKACTEGIRNITAIELIQFSMSAYFFGKTVFEPKTGYGIIKEAQRRYVMVEKRAKIADEGAQKKYDEFVEPEKRFGTDGKIQTIKDDWKGFTCSQEVCDELNANGDLIRNINAFDDLNQFFLEVSNTDSNLRMTKYGNIMVNEQLEAHGRKLNEIGKTKDGVNERRRSLLKFTSDYQKGEYSNSDLEQKVDASLDNAFKTSTPNLEDKQGLVAKFRSNLKNSVKDGEFHKNLTEALKDPDIKQDIDKAITAEEVHNAIKKAATKANSKNNTYTQDRMDDITTSALDGVGTDRQDNNGIDNKDTILSNFRKGLNKGSSDKKFNEDVSKAFDSPGFKEEFQNANTEDEIRAVLAKAVRQAEYQNNLRVNNFKFGEDRLSFEIDRKIIQTQFKDVTINGKHVFENMEEGEAAARLWRVTSNFGDRTKDIVEAAKNMAEKLNKNDPHEFVDLMEFVEYKYTKADESQQADFMNEMKDPNSAVFLQTYNEFEEAIRAVREIQCGIDIAWSSETSAAYHHFKHGKDNFTVNSNETNSQQLSDSNTTTNLSHYEELKADMTKYLNEHWRQAVKPENVTGQGHSQDGRTFRISYAFKIDDRRTHNAYTACSPDTQTDTKILSHFCPNNAAH